MIFDMATISHFGSRCSTRLTDGSCSQALKSSSKMARWLWRCCALPVRPAVPLRSPLRCCRSYWARSWL